MKVTSTFLFFTFALTLSLCATAAFGQNTQSKWLQGDIFLGAGSGQWKVFRPSAGAVVDSFSDGLNGATNGSAIDNTWHLITTDSGNHGNLSDLVRFRISPNDPNNAFPVTPVLSVLNSGGGVSTNPKSVIIDAAGNMIVANANSATIVKLGPSGNVLATVPIANKYIDKTLASADIDATGNVLYYTSGGNNIRQLTPISPSGTFSTVASISGQKFFGIRFVPAGAFPAACSFCPAAGGLLVAANSGLLLLDLSGNLLRTYSITGQNSLQVIALDPLVQDTSGNKQPPSGFWVSSPSSNNFYRVDFATGVAQTYSVNGISGISSIATYAGLSANQAVPTAFPPVTMSGNPSNSGTFLFNNGDQLTLTAYALPSGFSTTVSVFASSVATSGGSADGGQPCTPTISGLCTVWSADVNPPLPSGSLMSLKDLATQGGVDANTRVFRDGREDVTLGVANIDPIGRSLLSTYTLNQVPGNNEGCYYYPPVGGTPPVVLNNPGNITFRFTCTALTPTQMAALQPRISIVQLLSGAAPQPFFPGITTLTGGTCCTTADYRYDANANAWVINVSFNGASGNFLATTFDDSANSFKPSAFDVTFTVTK